MMMSRESGSLADVERAVTVGRVRIVRWGSDLRQRFKVV